MRLFVAVLPQPPLRGEIARIQGRLRDSCGGVKWVEAGNIHLTLQFLGNVSEERLDALRQALRSAARGVPAFSLAVRGVGAFPNVKRPRIVWVGLHAEKDSALFELHRRVAEALRPLGFEPEDRPFAPHLTLGRVRREHTDDVRGLSAALKENQASVAGTLAASGFSLMESRLSPIGPSYFHVEDFSLSPATT